MADRKIVGVPPVSFVDRLVGVFSPTQYKKRIRDRYVTEFFKDEFDRLRKRNAWKASEKDRLNYDWSASNKSPNEQLKTELKTMRARSRWLMRNNPYASSSMNAILNYVLGAGFSLQMQARKAERRTDAAGNPYVEYTPMQSWNDYVEDIFGQWAEDVNIAASETAPWSWVDLQEMMLRRIVEDGEIFVYGVTDPTHPIVPLRFELIEPDVLNENKTEHNGNPVVMGVELDKATWRPVAYWIRTDEKHPEVFVYDRESVRVPTTNMIHVYKPLRPGQVRGVPMLATVTRRFYDLDEYTEAELIGNKVAACFSVLIASNAGTEADAGIDAPSGASATDSDGNTLTNISPGMIGNLPADAQVSVLSPQKPGATYDSFVKGHLRAIAAGQESGMSYQSMTRDTTGTTFAGGRRAQQQDYQGWRKQQRWFARAALTPCLKMWMDAAVLSGRIGAPGYWSSPGPQFWRRHEWMAPGWSLGINPLQEIEAIRKSVRAGITTMQDESARFGYDMKTQMKKTKQWQDMARELGLVLDTDAANDDPELVTMAEQMEKEESEK